MTVALMWEARAAEGRGRELLAWARAQELLARPLRRETFRAPQDRALIATWGTRSSTPICPNSRSPMGSW